MSVKKTILAEAYISSGCEGDYWLEGDPVFIEVERQEDKIRVGVIQEPGLSEDAGIYLTFSAAKDLMIALGAALAEGER